MYLETDSEFVIGLDGLDEGLRSCCHLGVVVFLAAFESRYRRFQHPSQKW